MLQKTCQETKILDQGYTGSFGYESKDAQTLASWGADYLKLDGCNFHGDYVVCYSSKRISQ